MRGSVVVVVLAVSFALLLSFSFVIPSFLSSFFLVTLTCFCFPSIDIKKCWAGLG
jgi:hypothetical protein